MPIQIVPYTPEWEAAARAFNDRLKSQNKAEFLLSEHAPELPAAEDAIRNLNYVAADGEIVRGGLLIASYPAYIGSGKNVTVLNYREPLSEGIIDPKHSLLGLRLLKFVEQQGSFIFALGMGSVNAPFSRLLRGAGWSIRSVPFLFRILRTRKFLTQLRLLQASTVRRIVAQAAALTGTGKLGISVLQRRAFSGSNSTSGFTIERQTNWGTWSDELWEKFRPQCSFAVRRDEKTLSELYRFSLDRSQVFLLKRQERSVAWSACQVTRMQNDKYFGDMTIATVLDAVAERDVMRALLAMTVRELEAQGADAIVTNQSRTDWIEAFRAVGFLSQRSNYILATNKRLTEAISQQLNGWDRIHFTRGDGDGRYHL
jgi:hypothetical protein